MLFLRSFDACYHAELQDMWYKAHYKEAEKIRARPLGEYYTVVLLQVLLVPGSVADGCIVRSI